MIVPTSADYQRQYGFALDALRMLAQRDLLAWWDNTVELSFSDQRQLLEAPFVAITQTYGEQAAYAAADYLFQQRSLDESLAGLEYPEVASPVGFEQAKSSFRYAMWLKEYSEDQALREVAKRKLVGVLQRLVADPARRTVEMGVAAAGTGYARFPEPGACDFCLMLASRGAVYSAGTVVGGRATAERRKHGVGIGDVAKYHDNCRCLGIEVSDGNPLPLINRQLQGAWESAIKGQSDQFGAWQEYLRGRREQARRGPLWPRLKSVTVPKYRGDGISTVFAGEELPGLEKMPGHVLFGWRDRARKSDGWVRHSEDARMGHTYDSQRKNVSTFPEHWSYQEIVDAIRDTIENPMYAKGAAGKSGRREVWREFDGLIVKAEYTVIDGRARNDSVTGYPSPVKRESKGAREIG